MCFFTSIYKKNKKIKNKTKNERKRLQFSFLEKASKFRDFILFINYSNYLCFCYFFLTRSSKSSDKHDNVRMVLLSWWPKVNEIYSIVYGSTVAF